MRHIPLLFPLLLLAASAQASPQPKAWRLDAISSYDSGYTQGTEIISVQQSTLRAALSNFKTGEVDVLDISHPQHLQRTARYKLGLVKGEELTSVAFHPTLDLFAVVINAGNNPGRLELRSAATGELLNKALLGYGSDAVVFSKDGRVLMVANEGEDFWFDRAKKQFFTPEGSISIIHLDKTGRIESNNTLALADMTNHKGFVITQGGRYLEREIDWNGDGEISKKLDFDGNGNIEKKAVSLGVFEGHEVFGTETNGERKILIPIKSYSPALLEPEYIAISPDSSKAYVSLQEDDAVAVVDLKTQQVVEYYGLGATVHNADEKNDGWVKFDQTMTGLREPDGIATIMKGRYFVTADEGDTDASPAKPVADALLSGGRTVSIFDAASGLFVGDTGNQLDEMAFANHLYPDSRSQKKGAEPEMLVAFEANGTPLVAVGMERAGAVALVTVNDPTHPKVVALGKIPGDGDKSPEGIAHFEIAGEHYLLTANEMGGTVACFKVSK